MAPPDIYMLCSLPLDSHRLANHKMEVHESKRRHECHLCGQSFKRPEHLKNHINRHANPNRRKRGPQKILRKYLAPSETSGNESASASTSTATEDLQLQAAISALVEKTPEVQSSSELISDPQPKNTSETLEPLPSQSAASCTALEQNINDSSSYIVEQQFSIDLLNC
jgi:hypothetical protein